MKQLVLVAYFDGPPAPGFPGAGEGEAPLLRLIGTGFSDDLRVEHHHVSALVLKYDDAPVYADHVGRHADAVLPVGRQGVQQIPGCLQIFHAGGLRPLGQAGGISHDLPYHV